MSTVKCTFYLKGISQACTQCTEANFAKYPSLLLTHTNATPPQSSLVYIVHVDYTKYTVSSINEI